MKMIPRETFKQESAILATLALLAVLVGASLYSFATISYGNTFEVNSEFYSDGFVVANVYTTWTFAYDQVANQFVSGPNTFWHVSSHADWPFSISTSGSSRVTASELYSNVGWTFGWVYGSQSGTNYQNIASTNNGMVTIYWGEYGGPGWSSTVSLPLTITQYFAWGS